MKKQRSKIPPEILPVGTRVHKVSGLPFKSRLRVNTIAGMGEIPERPGVPAYRFQEDESLVECFRCEEDR